MNRSTNIVTWEELGSFSDNKTNFSHDDWAALYDLYTRLDRSTIPDGIEFPDLRPREMIEADATEKPARES